MANSLSDAIATGVQVGTQMRQAKTQAQQVRVNEMNAYTSALAEKRQLATAKANLDINKRKQELDEKQFNFKLGMELLKGLSTKLSGKSETDKQVFYTSDPGKAIIKEIKQRLGPGFVDDKGEPLLISDKELFDAQIAQMDAAVASKIYNKQPLTQGEQSYAFMRQKLAGGAFGAVFDAASSNPGWKWGDAKTRGQIFQEEIKRAMSATSALTNSDQGASTGGQPEPSMDEFLQQFRK